MFDMLAEPSGDFRFALSKWALRYGGRRGSPGQKRLYLNIGHTGLNDLRFRDWVGLAGVRPIYFVHDLIPITHPEFCRAGEQPKHQARMRTVLLTGAGVIGNSLATLAEFSSFAKAEDLPPPPAIAAPLGTDVASAGPPGPTSDSAGKPTFVILGTIEARKNHLMLLHVWTRLVQRLGSDAPHLLVVGRRGWECEQVLDLLERSPSLKQAVTEIGACDDQQLATHLGNARALLFPSFVEGYGIPLVDSMRLGTPIIASDLPVFREIAGDIPEYLDPLDGPAWERAIMSYADLASSRRERQVQLMSNFKIPTWEDHFEAVEAWLNQL